MEKHLEKGMVPNGGIGFILPWNGMDTAANDIITANCFFIFRDFHEKQVYDVRSICNENNVKSGGKEEEEEEARNHRQD
ncbi:unnamed protein product [Dovyalis caffra]|uniref:Uncharacterized protein n=1 Tax=Dovyalis caffra TaxID=77055 RepID=A0AAV1RCP9_9ROSI|nr:unnamed protein product [Dovyalis caffra]